MPTESCPATGTPGAVGGFGVGAVWRYSRHVPNSLFDTAHRAASDGSDLRNALTASRHAVKASTSLESGSASPRRIHSASSARRRTGCGSSSGPAASAASSAGPSLPAVRSSLVCSSVVLVAFVKVKVVESGSSLTPTAAALLRAFRPGESPAGCSPTRGAHRNFGLPSRGVRSHDVVDPGLAVHGWVGKHRTSRALRPLDPPHFHSIPVARAGGRGFRPPPAATVAIPRERLRSGPGRPRQPFETAAGVGTPRSRPPNP